jgi:O-antigen ligase/tetratricopeptide (TPR) repeat protein
MPLPDAMIHSLLPAQRTARMEKLLESEESCGQQELQNVTTTWNQISVDPPETKRQWIIVATALAICVVAMYLANDELCRLAMVVLLAVNGAAFGILALFQRASSPGMIYWTYKSTWQRLPFGAFVNRNHAGLFLALSALCALFGICLLLSHRIVRRTPHFDDDSQSPRGGVSLNDLRMIWLSQKDGVLFSLAFCALFCAISSIVAASRSGAIAFGAVVIVSAIMLFKAGADRRLILVIGVLGALAAFVSGAKLDFLINRFGAESVEAGWQGRYAHWSDVLDQASEFALTGLGHGSYAYGTLPYLSAPGSAWYQHADNQYVEVFVELGAIGALLILAFVVFFLARCVKLLRSRDLQSQIVGIFGFGLVAICAINAMGDFALAMPGVLLPMALAAGFVLGYRPATPSNSPPSTKALAVEAIPKLAIVGVMIWATILGFCLFANSQAAITPRENPMQWVARSLAKTVGEPGLAAITGDARRAVNKYVAHSREAVESLEPEFFKDDQFSIENLAILKRALDSGETDDEFQQLRGALRATEELTVAREHYLKAVALSPMRFESHMGLARIDLLLCPGPSVSKRVEHAQTINPTSGIDAGKLGVVSITNGDLEIGGRLLGQALREQPQLESNIFVVLKTQLTVQEVAKYVLKQDAQLLIKAADRHYKEPQEWAARNFIYSQLRQSIERGEVQGLTESESKYYLAKTKKMIGDDEGAFADFEAACSEWPTPLEWLKELAAYYREKEQWLKAKKILFRIRSEFEYDPNIDKQIDAIEKKLRAKTTR